MANANYYLTDDTGTAAALTVNGPPGGASGEILFGPFAAPTIAAAYQVAHIVSSAGQRPMRLVPVGAPPPYTLVSGVAPGVGLTQVPSGITY
jgi:hypothetical protein